MRVPVLDDWQNIAEAAADWSALLEADGLLVVHSNRGPNIETNVKGKRMRQPTDTPHPAGLSALRRTSRRGVIQLLDGPNMKYFGRRDPSLFGSIASIEALHNLVVTFGAALGVQIDTFVSDYEGDLLKQVHASAATADGYLVNPGGLTSVSEAWRHALAETRKPVVEMQFYNLATRNEISVFTPSAEGTHA